MISRSLREQGDRKREARTEAVATINTKASTVASWLMHKPTKSSTIPVARELAPARLRSSRLRRLTRRSAKAD